jgi:hypothetical protein
MIDLSDFETIDELEEVIKTANEKIQEIRDKEFEQEEMQLEDEREEFKGLV